MGLPDLVQRLTLARAIDTSRFPRLASLAVMVASGFAGLGYQIVWTQQCALWLGHEAAAVLAVVTAFFGGLAVGATALGPRIERSGHPARWYGACEVLIAAWSVVLALSLGPFSDIVNTLTGPAPSPLHQWSVAFVATFLVLLPATAAMGATLPAMARVIDRTASNLGSVSIGSLYAANTLGAVVGVLATAFWLIPGLGLARTAGLCAALNLVCAAAALSLPRAGPVTLPARPATPSRRVQTTLFMTGLLGIGYEVLVVRVISQVTENTVYTFAILLAVYLVGTTLGAAAHARWWLRATVVDSSGDRLLTGLAVACLAGTCSLWAAEDLRRFAEHALGGGMAGALGAEAALALAAFALPTIFMGALFSHLATEARARGVGLGRALGVNTAGAALAPVLFGVLLAPALGARLALLSIAAGYVALVSRRGWASSPMTGSAAAVALALAVWAPPLVFVDVPEGGKVISYREGVMAAVSVVEDAGGVSRLRIDNRQQEGSSGTRLADARQALLPLLLHPAPKRALFLGLGTGVTASAAADDASLEVDAVELLPEVIAASAHFVAASADGPPNPRLHLIAADARRFVRTAATPYDLIVADNFHPARSGSGALYTVEHFQSVGARLAPGGVFCQWLPLHQLDLATLASIVRSFLVAYPDGSALLATNSLETPVLGLVARKDGARFAPGDVRRRLETARFARPPAAFGLTDEFAVLGSFVAGPRALAEFAADAEPNTDDRPIVAYRAPRITYVPDSLPRDRLLALLGRWHLDPGELLAGAADDADLSSRLAAYWHARDRFLEAGRRVQKSDDVRGMLAQVQGPLLSVLKISPDFRPAYDPLLRMAVALGAVDPQGAAKLLQTLIDLQPARQDAVVARRDLDSRSTVGIPGPSKP